MTSKKATPEQHVCKTCGNAPDSGVFRDLCKVDLYYGTFTKDACPVWKAKG